MGQSPDISNSEFQASWKQAGKETDAPPRSCIRESLAISSLAMNLNPLAKIPCLLSAAISLHLTYTSPNPPAPSQSSSVARAPVSFADRLLRGIVAFRILHYVKACLWCAALIESAVIAANAYPSLPISKIILDKFLFGGDGSQIRFTPAAAAGVILAIAGSALRVWCYRELGKYFTFEMSVTKDHRLVTTGPYRIVRHPSYTGAIFSTAAIFLVHATKGSWVRESGLLRYLQGKIGVAIYAIVVCAILSGVLMRMKVEDRALRKRFEDKWDAWAAKVRYMVIPGVV